MSEPLDYVDKQALEYRRGFVLGLTLAEAMLLLLFVLLLVLVLEITDRQQQELQLAALQPILEAIQDQSQPEDLVQLFEKSMAIQEIENRIGQRISEDFIELVAEYQAQLSESQPDLLDIVESEKSKNTKLEAELSELQSDKLTLQGQLAETTRRLDQAGVGGTLPSCWSTPDGRTQYLLTVSLEDQGLRVEETIPDTRQFDRQRLPLEVKTGLNKMSMQSFLEWTQELHLHSVERKCRFYVRVFDATSPAEKDLFKQLLFGVERHFYKFMLSKPPAEIYEPS